MKQTLYHGSQYIIEKPEYGKGSIFNDYGQGFYCTKHIELAKEWACSNESGGYSNKYSIETNDLKVLRLNDEPYNILNWMAILLENRHFSINSIIGAQAYDYLLSNFLPDYKKYDVIIGYRADDSYFSFARAFINNTLSLQQLSKAMLLGNLGEQIVIKSRKAFERLKFEEYEAVDKNEYYAKRKIRDTDARESFKKIVLNTESPSDEVFILDIIRQKWRNEDVRI